MTLLFDFWTDITSIFSNSQQRLYFGYLASAVLLGLFWSSVQAKTTKQPLFSSLFSRQYWLNLSTFADYKIIFINKAIFLIVTPFLLTKLSLATTVFQSMHLASFPLTLQNSLPTWLVISLFTVFVFAFDDFARYYLHKLMHQIPWLWEFHKIHHSATTLTPLTVLRTHPVEGILFATRTALVHGLSIGVFFYIFSDQVDLYTVLNVNIFIFLFNIAGANLRHSHIPLRYWRWLENIIISPAQHQIHHSVQPRHFNKNYGAVLAIWDRIGKSLHYSEKDSISQFGLSATQSSSAHSLPEIYIAPLIQCWKKAIKFFLPIK